MTDELSLDNGLRALRPQLTQALQVLCPQLALVDCARLANHVIDEALEGRLSLMEGTMSRFGELLAADEAARRARDERASADEQTPEEPQHGSHAGR